MDGVTIMPALANEVDAEQGLAVLMLAGRRRRALGGPLVVALGIAACSDTGAVSSETDAESTSASTDTDASGSGEQVPIGWPRDWYGDYYEDSGIPLGREHEGAFLGTLGNMHIEAGTVTIQRSGYVLGSETHEWTFATELDGDVLRILPNGDEWDIPYSGADEVLLRPGAGCDELVLEAHGLPSVVDQLYSVSWLRGSICVVDPYDDTIPNDTWMIDLCPGSTTSCTAG